MTTDQPVPRAVASGEAVTPDRLGPTAAITPARLGLGRAGSGLPSRAALAFAMDHAQARDAVHARLDTASLAMGLAPLGLDLASIESAAPDRETYLRRPDFGRRLSRNARSVMAARPRVPCDVVLCVGDGLSARAVAENAQPLIEHLVPLLRARRIGVGPIVLVAQARVAIGDEIGALVGARLSVMLIGERPGLSAADSLGAYVTFDPRIGRTDAERNCVSNIRAAGLPPPQAAQTIAWLIERAFGLGLTGVALKDESDNGPALLPGEAPP